MKKFILKQFLRLYLRTNVKQGSAQHRAHFHELLNETVSALETAFPEDSRSYLKLYLKECVDEVDCTYP